MLIRLSMLRDVDFFQAKLSKIDGFGDAGEYLTTIIKSKQVKSAAPPAPAAAESEKKDPEEQADSAETEDASDDKEPETAEKADDKDAAKQSADSETK